MPLTMPVRTRQDLTGQHIVVVGGGMTGHRFASRLIEQDPEGAWSMTVIGDEPERPYDRVHLSEWFEHRDPVALEMDPTVWDDPRLTLITGDAAETLDRENQQVILASGRQVGYDRLVLATGSWAWAPRAEGKDLPGSFSYRTLADVEAIAEWVELRGKALGRPVRGMVVGGGVLGLEAAAALNNLGAETTVVEFADRLMSVQLDQGGGEVLRRLIEGMGIEVRTGVGATRFTPAGDGVIGRAHLSDDSELPVDVVIFSTGIRPRDRLAREAGLAIAERGGVVVGDTCHTSDPLVWAIGECASYEGRCAGLIAPGNDMADTVVARWLGSSRVHKPSDASTKLKGVGVDAAAFGDVNALAPGALEVTFVDPVHNLYRKLVVSDDAKTLLGGVFVGDIELYPQLRPLLGRPLGADPSALIAPEGAGAVDLEAPDDAVICSCNNVTAGTIREAIAGGAHTIGDVKATTKAGTVCGSCVTSVTKILNTELTKAGIEVSSALCEHFEMTRSELYKTIRDEGLTTFSEIIAKHGKGRGCAICRPTIASVLATLGRGHVLDGETGSLQDTNDHVMANLQKNGTYSVIPRMPGGEVLPEQLIEIGKVAQDYGLYLRVTGGQRLALFGARLDQLPEIWKRLIAVGLESGQGYGKSLRTVKTCVGRTWCRYGVQDSTSMAVRLEMRYRGLRSPHKFKFGVSGCARECAEAQGKDIGVIATNKGWNLYVGGNGGMTPAHAQLLASDLDDETLVRYIDRFVMYYIQEADRLQRTARWVEEYPGGMDALREVIVNDSLGLAEGFEKQMDEHVANYSDEWADTLADPEKLSRFVAYVNAPGLADPDLAFAPERGQARPAQEGDAEVDHDLRRARALGLADGSYPAPGRPDVRVPVPALAGAQED